MGLALRALLLALMGCSFVVFESSAQDSESPFAAASAAFASGDYRAALALFETARAAGAEGPAASYNIAVCRYKLGEYAAAEADFAALGARFPSMRALADYNRGLALRQLDRGADAEMAFTAARSRGDAKITALAAAQLRELGADAPLRTPRTVWDALLELGVGRDDNVALVDDLALPAGESADSPFLEAVGYASRWVGDKVPMRVDLNAYLVRYPDAARFDQESFSAAVAFQRSPGVWRIDFGPQYYRSTLDGEGFVDQLGAAARFDRPLERLGEGWRFGAGIWYSDVGGLSSRFAYLDGARRQARAAISRRAGDSTLEASFDVEDSDRAAASVSAMRRRLTFGIGRAVGPVWFVTGTVAYRASAYDRVRDSDEQLTELHVNARRALGRDWRLTADYRRSENDADLTAFTYEANRFVVSIDKSF